MSSHANKSDRMKITGNCRVCTLEHNFYLLMEKFDNSLEPVLTEKERMGRIWNCARCEHFNVLFD